MAKKQLLKSKRAVRVRKFLTGTAERPRLCVVKSNQHLEAQLIDDDEGRTLVALSTKSKEMKGTENNKKSKQAAKVIGEKLATMAKGLNITSVVFDRGSHKYHGVLQELADSARAAGLKI